MIMRSEDVTITKGSAKEHWTLSAKGNRIARCGTPLFAKNEKHPETSSVRSVTPRSRPAARTASSRAAPTPCRRQGGRTLM
jgi:hypothetical protein